MKPNQYSLENQADNKIIRLLQDELAETNRGLIALSMEFEQRVDERTEELRIAQEKLRIAQEELQRTNSDLLMLTMELEDRVAERTEELTNALNALHQEIPERKKAEESLEKYRDHLEDIIKERTTEVEQAKRLAEAANRSKSSFLAKMSHELRTPMNAVLGFSNLMIKDSTLTGRQIEYLDIINRSGKHLLALINDILDMSKIESGQITVEISPFDLTALVRDITDMVRNRINEKGLQFLVDQADGLPRHILGDEAKLRQILLNLLSNACKFTQQGGITLRLGIMCDAITPKLLVEVEDSGIGMNLTDQARIFEAFFQIAGKSIERGTGLGLAISHKFVELMGGTLVVESTPGIGSLFRIELPVELAEDGALPLPEGKVGEVIGLEPGQEGYRILIVEDQKENALLLQTLMESVGFEVRVAENGAVGIKQFEQFKPDFVWMDRRMPVMDGIEATRRIRAMEGGQSVKIVAVTASVFKEQRDELLASGMEDIVNKPYRPDEIFNCMTKHLGVQFIRQTQAILDQSAPVVTPAALAKLPVKLRTELEEALVDLDTARIEKVVALIGSHDPELGRVLRYHTKTYQYTAMIHALEATPQLGKREG